MTKSIRYKIMQIENVVVFHQCHYTGKVKTINVKSEHGIAVFHLSSFAKAPCFSFDMPNKSEALILINEIHAAIHQEFAGEWEPKEGEEVLVKDESMDEPKAVPQKFLMTDVKGRHWTASGLNIAYPWDKIEPVNQPEIPTGPCEVCYGVEGCDEGVQEKPETIDELRQLVKEFDKVNKQIGVTRNRYRQERNEARAEAKSLKQEIEVLKKAAKEKPLIRLDIEPWRSTWDSSRGFYDEIKRQMISQGVDFDWIGGVE